MTYEYINKHLLDEENLILKDSNSEFDISSLNGGNTSNNFSKISQENITECLAKDFNYIRKKMKFSFLNLISKILDKKSKSRILSQLIHYMYAQKYFTIEGISRLSGRHNETEKVRFFIKNNKFFKFEDYTPFELINGIKTYIFKDLDGCLNEESINIITSVSLDSVKDKTHIFINCLLFVLDSDDAYMFLYMLRLLGLISKMSYLNKMNSKSLSIIFMPVMVGERKMKKLDIISIKKINLIFEEIIDKFK